MKSHLKFYSINIRMWLHDKFCDLFRISNTYRIVMKEAILEINTLRTALSRVDRDNSLDVRSQLEVVDFSKLGDIVWIKVADDRMLRQATFTQIRDYMRGHGQDRAILLVTKSDVQLASLTDEDLQRSGLKRMQPNERQ